jgi:NAD(P)-dependent dehydrogenase (short-subunit alcohol dehydrogenase family)
MLGKKSTELRGSVVVVTGGARGIGRALAAALVTEGAQVWIGDLDPELVAATARDLGGATRAFALDVTDPEGFTAALDHIERTAGPIDVLVNNAGVMPVGRFEDETPLGIQRIFDVNVFGLMHGTGEAIRRMRPRGRGHIVNVASMAGVTALPGAPAYSASKHAVVGFCEALAYDLRGTGIQLSYILPGMVNTELAAGVKRNPIASTVEPEVVAQAIVGTLRRPRMAVFVPRQMRIATTLAALTPKSFGRWVARISGADHLLTDSLASPERARYAHRITTSTPGADRRRGGT